MELMSSQRRRPGKREREQRPADRYALELMRQARIAERENPGAHPSEIRQYRKR